jgi:hypothetical protein
VDGMEIGFDLFVHGAQARVDTGVFGARGDF